MSLKPDEIRSLRESLALSQQQLAELTGVHWMTVSRWERGQLVPAPFQEALLCKFRTAAGSGAVVAKAVAALLSKGTEPMHIVYVLLAFAESGESRGKGEGISIKVELPDDDRDQHAGEAGARDKRARSRSETQEGRPAPRRGRQDEAGESQA